MRTVYFDCHTGAAGNMILAALLDAGADIGWLQKQLRRMPLGKWSLKLRVVKKCGIAGLHLSVDGGAQTERNFDQICQIIKKGKYSSSATERSIKIFRNLARAEAKVHRTSIDKVHFHEVGAVDSIVDIVGTCLALESLKIEEVLSSPLNVGHGQSVCAHGILPVPAPATAWLLKGIRIYQNDLQGELVTPTGAAILASLSADFGPMPEMTIDSVGHGAGSRDLEVPNLLRALVGRRPSSVGGREEVVLLETNIDDLNPQVYQHLMDRLLESGALDVWLIPIHAKKNRPGILLSALVPLENELSAVDLIFRETTTGGLRRRLVERYRLPREIVTVKTRYGPVRGKLFFKGKSGVMFRPEYQDCLRLARKNDLPLLSVQDEAIRSWRMGGRSKI